MKYYEPRYKRRFPPITFTEMLRIGEREAARREIMTLAAPSQKAMAAQVAEVLGDKLEHFNDNCLIVNAFTRLLYSGEWGRGVELAESLPSKASLKQYDAWMDSLIVV